MEKINEGDKVILNFEALVKQFGYNALVNHLNHFNIKKGDVLEISDISEIYKLVFIKQINLTLRFDDVFVLKTEII